MYAMKTLLVLAIFSLAIWWVSGSAAENIRKDKQTNSKKNVTLTVYYETYCPDSVAFILDQLYPVHASLREKLILDFVPFGKAQQIQGDGEPFLDCQHGMRECDANMVHACAVREACGEAPPGDCPWSQRSRLVEFIYCNMGQEDRLGTAEECAKKAGLEWDEIKNCTKSNTGTKMLSHFGNRTSAYRPVISMHHGMIPSIAIDEAPNFKAVSDLRVEICKLHPSIC